MSYFAALDIGSSFIKAAAFDLSASKVLLELKTASPSRIDSDDPNRYEVDARAYTAIVKKMLADLVAKYPEIKGVLFSTQQHGFVIEHGSANPVYVSWRDQRCIEPYKGSTYLDFLRKTISRELMLPCGVDFKPMMGLCNLFTMLEQHPEIPRDVSVSTIGSYLIRELTGNNVAHPQNLAPIGIFNVRERRYNTEVLHLLNLDKIRLPEVIPSDTECCGQCRIAHAILDVYPDYGDVQIAVLGSEPGRHAANINIATAAQINIPIPSFVRGPYETRPYFNGHYLKTVSALPSGRNLDVIIDFIRKTTKDCTGAEVTAADVWNILHQQIRMAKGTLEVDPRFFATPDHLTGGSIANIEAENFTAAEIMLSAFKSMAGIYKKKLEEISSLAEISEIVCSGGVSWKVPELVSAIHQATGIKCRLSVMQDEVLNGMLIMASRCA